MNLNELQELIDLYKERHYLYKDDELELISEKKTVKVYKFDGYFFKFKNDKLDYCWEENEINNPLSIKEWKKIVEDEDMAYVIQADEENEAQGLQWDNGVGIIFKPEVQKESNNE